MTYRELREQIRDYEGELAYGSETTLWGEFYRNPAVYREEGADDENDEVDEQEAIWWLTAYASLERYQDLPGATQDKYADEFFTAGLFNGDAEPSCLAEAEAETDMDEDEEEE
jgi:hypothetical protein